MQIERRNGKRYASQFGVVFHDGGGLSFSFIANLSRSGVYLTSETLFAKGTELTFSLSNGNVQVPVRGKVVRVVDHVLDAGQSGMGVEFVTLSPCAKRIRDDLLLCLMSSDHHGSWN